jgi:hypothetical protein
MKYFFILKAGEECSKFLDGNYQFLFFSTKSLSNKSDFLIKNSLKQIKKGRVKFEEIWNVYEKMQWCRDTIDYVNCANQYLLYCNISSVKNDADQLQSFIDYITKSSNVHCPGGINGCDNNTNDIRCKLGIRYFMGEINNNNTATTSRIFFSQLVSFLFTLIIACLGVHYSRF